MNDAVTPNLDALLDTLRLLCAQQSVVNQHRGLADGADAVASILRDVGLDCTVLKTSGAPIVVGRYNAGASKTLLLYGRYDVPPPGLRRNWSSDPFQPTLRDNAIFARGAVVKAELVARAAALRSLIAQNLALNVVFVVEGDSLSGSPYLSTARDAIGTCDASVWSGGNLDGQARPLLYTGVKGLLQVELTATTASTIVPLTYAATVPNPLWTLTYALASIKSEFEEILLEGFYDDIVPPDRAAMRGIQQLDLDEQARRDAWGVERFVANVSGALLARTEIVSPTCNISAINVTNAGLPAIPQRASAELQFQLVPAHQPERVFELLSQHLEQRGFDRLEIKQLVGAYGPSQSPELGFDPAASVAAVYGAATPIVPLAPFSAPLALLAPNIPFVSCGLERATSALLGADEHVYVSDLVSHVQLATALIRNMANV